MVDVPWFMLSPSPVSLIQYAVLTWIIGDYLLKNIEYRRAPRVMSLIEGFFVVAFFVCITDAFWCSFTMLKWVPLHPGDAFQIGSSLLRDLVAALLFFLFIGDYFRQKVLNFSSSVSFWLLICFVSQAAWFWLAPSPAFTDYTYAWKHGYPWISICFSWAISHFIMRIPLWIAIIKTRRELL